MVGRELSIFVHDHAAVLGAESRARRLGCHGPLDARAAARQPRAGVAAPGRGAGALVAAHGARGPAIRAVPGVGRLRAASARSSSRIRGSGRPALAVGVVVAGYLTLDAGRIPRGWTIGRDGSAPRRRAGSLRHAEFFVLEAGLVGAAILAIRASGQVVLALAMLALLPLVSFGAANDFVMRVSIPSLTVLAIAACRALAEAAPNRSARIKRGALAGLLALGAVTPFQEFARAAVLERWPINLDATLVGADVRQLPAALRGASARPSAHARFLRPAHALRPDPQRGLRESRAAHPEFAGSRMTALRPARLDLEELPQPRAAGAAAAAAHALREPHRPSRRQPLGARCPDVAASSRDVARRPLHSLEGPCGRGAVCDAVESWTAPRGGAPHVSRRRHAARRPPRTRLERAHSFRHRQSRARLARGARHGARARSERRAGSCLLPHLGRRMAGGRHVGGADLLGAPAPAATSRCSSM